MIIYIDNEILKRVFFSISTLTQIHINYWLINFRLILIQCFLYAFAIDFVDWITLINSNILHGFIVYMHTIIHNHIQRAYYFRVKRFLLFFSFFCSFVFCSFFAERLYTNALTKISNNQKNGKFIFYLINWFFYLILVKMNFANDFSKE